MQEIYALQQDSKSVTTFYSKLKVSWEDSKMFCWYCHISLSIYLLSY